MSKRMARLILGVAGSGWQLAEAPSLPPETLEFPMVDTVLLRRCQGVCLVASKRTGDGSECARSRMRSAKFSRVEARNWERQRAF
jgi:hypothetical protein